MDEGRQRRVFRNLPSGMWKVFQDPEELQDELPVPDAVAGSR